MRNAHGVKGNDPIIVGAATRLAVAPAVIDTKCHGNVARHTQRGIAATTPFPATGSRAPSFRAGRGRDEALP